ncbi:MAG TPA: hypothetical protein ENJ77_01750, partial [Candidatus Moranbacteria bacterium]|nr:hypothetical protein [Candidatus Moranbacteria bacterium]
MSPPSSNLRSVRRFNPVPRIRFLAVLAVLAASVLLGRLWFLQVKDGPLWRERAERQYMISAELPPERGEIFFSGRDGIYPAAVNKDYLLLYIVPREIKEEQREEVVRFLRDLLGEKFDEEKLRAKLARSDDPYEIVARKLDVSLEEKVREQAPPGVYTQREKYRFYPAGALAAETIGFLTPTGEKGRYRGVYGLERSFEKFLAGKDGSLKQARDSAGRWISLLDREFRPAEDGADLILTIDRAVQTAAREILKETVKRHRADRGSILVMRPDGDILAMASEPNFDPNNYGRVEDQSLFVNPIVSHTYELGSVVKPITMAAGLDSGKISPETTFVDVGFVKEAGYTIRNSQDKVYGRQTMTEVLENSINTGVIFVEKT